MIRKYCIAGFNVEIDFENDSFFEEKLSEYAINEMGSSDISICAKRTDKDINIKQNNIIKLSDIAFFYREENKDIIFFHDPAISKTIAKIEFSKDYRRIDISMYELKAKHGVQDNMLMFNVVGTAIAYAFLMHKTFVFHSSSICYEGVGIAFSALSGTGKSTHTQLWLKKFPGTYILNDDIPVITLGKDGVFYICGTPWAGTTGINKNSQVPLKALVFLERGEKNEITKISSQDAMKPFFEAVKTPLTDEMFAACLDTLNMLLLNVPVYRLKCNMDLEAAIVARDGIFGRA